MHHVPGSSSKRGSAAIAVFGEVILDLIANSSGDHTPHLGGSPFNVALGLARQDIPVHLLSPLSDDPIGARFATAFTQAGGILQGGRSTRPTSLALVWVDSDGQPDYALYRQGIADLDTTAEALRAATPDHTILAHTGALTLTPDAIHIVQPWMRWLRGQGIVVSIDVNFRARAASDHAAYVRAVEQTYPLCDIVKLSEEDLSEMGRSGDLDEEADRILAQLPAATGLVVVTEGARGARLLNRTARVHVPAAAASTVIDTVGAGDCFQAGLLTAIYDRGLLTDHRYATADADILRALGEHARSCAVLNVERHGSDPPTRAEVQRRMA